MGSGPEMMSAMGMGQLSVDHLRPSHPLQQAACLDRQIIQRHLQLRNRRADLRMLSDFLLQRF